MKKSGPLLFTTAEWHVKLVLRHQIPVLIAVLAATLFFIFQLSHLKLATQPVEGMYPPLHPFLPGLRAIEQLAPRPPMVVLILEVKKGDIYNPHTLKKIDNITRRLIGISGIIPSGITSLTNGIDHLNQSAEGLSPEPVLGALWPETDDDFDKLKRKMAINAMGLGRYVSYDGSATMITANLIDIKQKIKKDFKQLSNSEKVGLSFKNYEAKQIKQFNVNLLKNINALKAKDDDDNHTLYFMGAEILTAQMTAIGKRDIPMAATATLFVIIAFLFLRFKTFKALFIPLSSMVMALIWALGLLSLYQIELNPMALLFPLTLGLLTMAMSTLDLERSCHPFNKKMAKREALIAAYGKRLPAGSVLTVGLIIMSMSITNVPMIRELGYLGLFWLLGSLVSLNLFSPIIMNILKAHKMQVFSHSSLNDSRTGYLFSWLSQGKVRYGLWTLSIGLLIGSFFGIPRLKIGDNIPGPSYVQPNHPWNQCFKKMEEKFMGPNQLLVHVQAGQQGGLLEPEAINGLGDFSSYLKNQGGARDSIAFDMMIKITRATMMDGNPKWLTVPDNRDQISGLANLVMSQGGVESFMDKTFTEATISPFFPSQETDDIERYATKMQAYIDSHPSDRIQYRLGGGLLGMAKIINDGTGHAYKKTLVWSFIVLLIGGTLAAGSLWLSLVIALPIALTQAALWNIMVALSIPVSLPIVPILTIGIGFGFIFGYHLLCNANALLQNTFKAINEILFIALLLFFSLLPWFFVGMRTMSSMAFILGLTLSIEALLAVLIVPAIINRSKR